MDFETTRLVARFVYYGVCVIAVLRGDRPLRFAGATIVTGALVSPILQAHQNLNAPQYGVMVADVVMLAVLCITLVRNRRWWLVVATAVFLMSTLTHLAGLIGTPINPRITATARLFWNYCMIAALGWGVIVRELHRRNPQRRAEAMVRALVAEQGEARTRAELDRRYLVATDPREKARAAELSEALRQMALTRARDGAI